MTDLITLPRAAVQQALEALERIAEAHGEWTNGMWAANKALKVIPALRAALEQPEQEPVAWMYVNSDKECEQIEYGVCDFDDPCITLLFTHPPRREWRGLTEEEISAVFPSHLRGDYKDLIPYSFARAIEAALKERNNG